MMKSLRFEEDKNMEENMIKNVRNLFRLKKKIKQLNTEYSEILEIFMNMKKKVAMNQQE